MATLVARLKNPAARHRSLGAKVAVVPPSQRQRRPGQTEKLQSLTPTPHNPISLPELNSKDSEEEWKTNHYSFACHMDADFSVWRDKKNSEGLKQWNKWKKMTCNHVDPCKEVKYPDPLGTPLDYMERYGTFKPVKTSEYDLHHFYQVGLTGAFPEFQSL